MRILVHGLVGTNLGGIETFLLNMNEAMSDECIFDWTFRKIYQYSQYEISTIPTLILFNNGDVIKNIVGLRDKSEIVEFVNQNI